MTVVRWLLSHTDVKALRTTGAAEEQLSGRVLRGVQLRVGEVQTDTAVTLGLHCKNAKEKLQCIIINYHM